MPGSRQLPGLTPACLGLGSCQPALRAPSTWALWKVPWPLPPCNKWVGPPGRRDCPSWSSLFNPALHGTDRETKAQELRGLAQTHARVGRPGIPGLHVQGQKETGQSCHTSQESWARLNITLRDGAWARLQEITVIVGNRGEG